MDECGENCKNGYTKEQKQSKEYVKFYVDGLVGKSSHIHIDGDGAGVVELIYNILLEN
jgi:hypothetical protein